MWWKDQLHELFLTGRPLTPFLFHFPFPSRSVPFLLFSSLLFASAAAILRVHLINALRVQSAECRRAISSRRSAVCKQSISSRSSGTQLFQTDQYNAHSKNRTVHCSLRAACTSNWHCDAMRQVPSRRVASRRVASRPVSSTVLMSNSFELSLVYSAAQDRCGHSTRLFFWLLANG